MKKSFKSLDLQNQRVLMRVDFNVPIDASGHITDDSRIRNALPTIQYLLENGAKLILMSHLGSPKGERKPALSLAPITGRLEELLGQDVQMAPDSIGEAVEKLAFDLQSGQVLLLENLRFHLAEEKPETDPSYAERLAKLGNLYVNDAFGTCHRSHSSMTGVPRYFPDQSAAGLLVEKEIEFLQEAFTHPEHPFHAIIGGAKIDSKIGVLRSLLEKVDAIYIGGGMAFTFLKAKGCEIANSFFNDEYLDVAQDFISKCEERKIPLYLPSDAVIADGFSNDAKTKLCSMKEPIPEGWMGLDVGPETVQEWSRHLSQAKTIFWNGPLGVYEMSSFKKGTEEIARYLGGMDAQTIIGGGDSVAAINALGIGDQFTHLSTGGGAALEFIETGSLPGIDALSEKE